MKEYKLNINGSPYSVAITHIEDNVATVEVNGTSYNVEMEKAIVANAPKKVVQVTSVPTVDTRPVKTSSPSAVGAVKAPLPGVILSIAVKVGDKVSVGQKLLMLEAMKMENAIEADRNGTVAAIKVNQGDSILEGADLVIIE